MIHMVEHYILAKKSTFIIETTKTVTLFPAYENNSTTFRAAKMIIVYYEIHPFF